MWQVRACHLHDIAAQEYVTGASGRVRKSVFLGVTQPLPLSLGSAPCVWKKLAGLSVSGYI